MLISMLCSSWTTSARWVFNGSKFFLEVPLSQMYPNVKVLNAKVLSEFNELRIEGIVKLSEPPKNIIWPYNINGTSSEKGLG